MEARMVTPEGKPFGPYNGNAKLTFADVDEIRRLRKGQGLTYRVLGHMFNVDHKTARLVATGKTWQHTTGKVIYQATLAELDQIRTMVENNVGIKRIAVALGVSDMSVRSVMALADVASLNPPPGRKTHCKHDHAYTGDNLHVLPNGKHQCKECKRRSSREYQRKRRALAKANQKD